MATTTNFGWETPDDTDLVKDGAAAIRTALGGVDTSFVDLKGGTSGQILSKASNTDLDYSWVTPTGGMTLLSTTSLSGTSTTISGISQSYTSLQVHIDKVVFNANAELNFYFNATSGYYMSQIHNATLTSQGGQSKIRFNDNTLWYAGVVIDIPFYTVAKAKSGQAYSAGQYGGSSDAVFWADLSEAAITQLVITSAAGTSTFSSGTVKIYGVK